MSIVDVLVSLLPVFFVLLALILLDSFKLVSFHSVAVAIGIGCLAAVAAFLINTTVVRHDWLESTVMRRYAAPLVEEAFKATFVVFLLQSSRIGFMVDAAIYGFAIGSGFSFVENVYYLHSVQEANVLLWIIRGFGTAVMHGGTTALFAILSKTLLDRYTAHPILSYVPGFLLAVCLHSVFNHFLLGPVLTTMGQLIVLPLLITIVFRRSESSLRNWLEVGFDTDMAILEMIDTGNITQTKIGKYLESLKSRFRGIVVADMLCYVRIHIELTIRAKGLLIMKQSGFQVTADQETRDKLAELKYLEKSIGKTGRIALSPFLHLSGRDLWQLYILDES